MHTLCKAFTEIQVNQICRCEMTTPIPYRKLTIGRLPKYLQQYRY